MTMSVVCRVKSYIQPFERRLALAELRALGCEEIRDLGHNEYRCEIKAKNTLHKLVERLSFFESIKSGEDNFITNQIFREAATYVVRNGIPLKDIRECLAADAGSLLPNRRCLRYGTHGIHEYRGKFFPQLVRSLINVADVRPNGIVADPMCGSGTTLVEGILLCRKSIGIDMNPLSVFMSRVKCNLLRSNPSDIEKQYQAIRDYLLSAGSRQHGKPLVYFSRLEQMSQQYLEKWFSSQVLEDLDVVASRILKVKDAAIKEFMLVSLSNIIRRVSWQKDDDLRVRKEIRDDVEIDPIREFLEEFGRSVRIVLAFLYRMRNDNLGSSEVIEGDARSILSSWRSGQSKVDAVITSPPYATALPYLDTDRLSLIYLGLLPRDAFRARDREMIGNREITEKERREQHDHFRREAKSLPASIVNLINRINELNEDGNAGFRRKNLPALLAKYFFDMKNVLNGILSVLKPGKSAYIVVGDNHTMAGGRRIEIKTADLLSELGESIGLKAGNHISMEMLSSRDIFRKNAGNAESILVLRRPD